MCVIKSSVELVIDCSGGARYSGERYLLSLALTSGNENVECTLLQGSPATGTRTSVDRPWTADSFRRRLNPR